MNLKTFTLHRIKLVSLLAVCMFLFFVISSSVVQAQQNSDRPETKEPSMGYQYVCDNNGSGLSAVDVLRASGEYTRFIELFSKYDTEGLEILSNPVLADKTVWAPTDAAFESVEYQINKMSASEIKAILGYHISPPQSSPNGNYPIITPDHLWVNSPETFRTRTGVLTGSEQRITSSFDGNRLFVEDVEIAPVSWCNQAGSVFSLNEVILSVEIPSTLTKFRYQVVRILLYDDIRFFIYSATAAVTIGAISGTFISHKKKNRSTNK